MGGIKVEGKVNISNVRRKKTPHSNLFARTFLSVLVPILGN